ncbi:MAG TPA: YdeI/OmpD-associated family protein [Candidatus Dormibacteraeota bacterium]
MAPTMLAIAFRSKAAWASWLDKNHGTPAGIWLKLARKASGIASVSHDEAVEVALCYGWIDGQADTFDAEHWLQRFTPRRARSKWSKINCARATELINTGRMKPAGLREVERAKADGRWAAAYDAQSAATIPEDLGRALKKSGKARASFKALDSRNRYAILYRIQDAKKPETRARRIATFVQMLEDGSTLYP